ncbi:CDH23 [Branchiostoma lanceolatum]|uniref:CDH23 protein n=1 Tax=Branchiostoma lanceolatum TaxID=7740 RepID=A0A8J9YLJ3_BRALA|nr:CDH23 [Branchiostoma lanceolatum]
MVVFVLPSFLRDTAMSRHPGGLPPVFGLDSVIRVLDNGKPPRFAETAVELSLLSNEAVGNLTRLEVSVAEDVAIGTAIVNATVPESAGDGTIIYTYVMQDPSGLNENYFDVHNETGEITVISGLDRETEPSHEFFVEPIADSGCDRQGLILVIIKLEDINDNDPVFEHQTLLGTVRENTPIDDPVTVGTTNFLVPAQRIVVDLGACTSDPTLANAMRSLVSLHGERTPVAGTRPVIAETVGRKWSMPTGGTRADPLRTRMSGAELDHGDAILRVNRSMVIS